jgi:hypothetical protein
MNPLSSPISIFLVVISIILICSCSTPETVTNQQTNLNANNSQNTPSQNSSPSASSFAPIDQANDPRPQIKSYTSNVSWKGEGDEHFVSLPDNQWYILPNHALVNTDENGEGVLSINGCLLVHIFRSSGLKTSSCSKTQSMSGSFICSIAGVSAFKNRCGDKVTLETSGVRIVLDGTWLAIAYLPDHSTVTIVLEGRVRVWPIEEGETVGEAAEVTEGQFWFSRPRKLSGDAVNGVAARQPQSLTRLSAVKDVLKISPWLGSIESAATKDKVPKAKLLRGS